MVLEKIVWLDSVGSTLDWAKEHRAFLPKNCSLVVAREQTQGRGSRQKGFVSQPGGLYITIPLRPKMSEGWEQRLILSLTYHTQQWLYQEYSLGSSIKPPNDLLVEGRKIMGVMVETVFLGNTLELCLLGCGFNILQDFRHHDYDFPATSLREHRPMCQAPESILRPWLSGWDLEKEGLI